MVVQPDQRNGGLLKAMAYDQQPGWRSPSEVELKRRSDHIQRLEFKSAIARSWSLLYS